MHLTPPVEKARPLTKLSAVELGDVGKGLSAARKGDDLIYVGGVGTGFPAASDTVWQRQGDQMLTADSMPTMVGRHAQCVGLGRS